MIIEIIPQIATNIEQNEYSNDSIGEREVNPAADSNCTPYGINPCTLHENKPSKLADFFDQCYIDRQHSLLVNLRK